MVDAVCCIAKKDEPVDLHMVEIMHMKHKLDSDTRFVSGLVLDHGARHPDMKKHVEDAFILTCNVSLEYEKSEVNSSFMYGDAEQRERMVAAEREYTDDVVRAVIALKKKVCDGTNKGFVVITQKGIDPISLDMLAKENILGLRRAKKRNMERLILSRGGVCANSPEEFAPEILGEAGKVYEHVLGEEKYTFVEDVATPQSCTILLKGPNDHTLAQLKDAVRDGLAGGQEHAVGPSRRAGRGRVRGGALGAPAGRDAQKRGGRARSGRGGVRGGDAGDPQDARREQRVRRAGRVHRAGGRGGEGEQGGSGRHHGRAVRPHHRRRVRQLHRQGADPALRAGDRDAAPAGGRGDARGGQHAQEVKRRRAGL